ncbi:aldolase [Ramlibacter sp. G-1-2-2]|uniref:Aldolase n=1 Tax=Ramlibacter agri TaxID=2728837 RepID=A0A848H743_9BURK|nr:aldolase/citrate lyase family protein [Ramlibacter agri]NML45329.1 aldolase [Ramlibacter agri]
MPSHPSLIAMLERREPVLALGVRHARSPDIARYARASGHHCLWVDLEHSTMPVDIAGQICAAALDLGLVPLVRVPERDYGVIGRLLDAGALGIIAPRIETPEQAADLVAACRFPPLGHRSAIASLPQWGHARMPAAELQQAANAATVLQVLLESPRGIANAEAIARVPGVDMLAIGTNDLSAELGVPGDFRHSLVRAAHQEALAACARAGKPLAIGGIADPAYAAELMRQGAAPFVMTGIDSDILLAALNERARHGLEACQA